MSLEFRWYLSSHSSFSMMIFFSSVDIFVKSSYPIPKSIANDFGKNLGKNKSPINIGTKIFNLFSGWLYLI